MPKDNIPAPPSSAPATVKKDSSSEKDSAKKKGKKQDRPSQEEGDSKEAPVDELAESEEEDSSDKQATTDKRDEQDTSEPTERRSPPAWIEKLGEAFRETPLKQQILLGVLASGVLIVLLMLIVAYENTTGSYATVGSIEVEQHPIEPGTLDITMDIKSPGKVRLTRQCGGKTIQRFDYFSKSGKFTRRWSAPFKPGRTIHLEVGYRSGMFGSSKRFSRETPKKINLVFLLAPTAQTDPYLDELRIRAPLLINNLVNKDLEFSFAVVGIGVSGQQPKLSGDLKALQDQVKELQRGRTASGRNVLDAIQKAMALPIEAGEMHRFMILSDAPIVAGNASEKTRIVAMAKKLKDSKIQVRVFSLNANEKAYRLLLGETGRFFDMAIFPDAVGTGRIFED